MTLQKELSKFLKLTLTNFAAGRKLTLGYMKETTPSFPKRYPLFGSVATELTSKILRIPLLDH